jgi:hypothetical protein
MEHLSELCLNWTDYTRHWMSSGDSLSPNHTDITNLYFFMGLLAGLPLMLLFILLLANGFSIVGRLVRLARIAKPEHDFFCSAQAASLFAARPPSAQLPR